MQQDKDQAEKALKFARQHDWGKRAWLVESRTRGWVVVDLQGDEGAVQVPATIKALRDFGNY